MRPPFLPLLALIALSVATESQARSADTPYQVAARGVQDPDARPQAARPNSVVRRIQKLLSKIGIYQGPVDGLMGPATSQAIRTFQKSRGLKVDGKATEDLATTLESDEKVDALLQRLQTVREQRIDTARQALLADPRTRHLIEQAPKDEVADPTRDATACFAAPTPDCLIFEASESAKAIFKDELRDWALGEILSAEARAGLSERAMRTARRITDPRLVMVALREIAEALAQAGETQAAMRAADIIPDSERQLDAYAAIAAIQTTLYGHGSLETVLARMKTLLTHKGTVLELVKFHAQAATLYHGVGRNDASTEHLSKARQYARRLADKDQNAALRHIALALADMSVPDEAMGLLARIDASSDRTPVLSGAARALARNGMATQALDAARDIDEARYRTVALSDVAGLLAHKGQGTPARQAIKEAQSQIDDIKLPYARAYAASRAAVALLDLATASGDAFNDAVYAADKIEDSTLRAYTLWAVATEQRRSGDKADATFTETLAHESVTAIKSRLSQVWLYGDLTVEFANAGEKEPAWKAFQDGLKIAEDITNPWGRARALAKLTGALTVLTEPDAPAHRRKGVSIPDSPIPNGTPQ